MKAIASFLFGVSLLFGAGAIAAVNPIGASLCAGQPTMPGPVYVGFDEQHLLYSDQLTVGPDGTYIFTRHYISNAEVAMICGAGFDLRVAGMSDFFPAVIEYYHAGLDHYFIATNASEIADLDSGVHKGWARTDEQFRSYVTDPSWPSGQAPLSSACRYYGLPAHGLNTHFFSAFPEECATVIANWPERWILETPVAFRMHLPDSADGACSVGTVPLYRLYNNRADVNHRYTTSLVIRQQMIDRGWIPEGHGPLAVAGCVREFL